MGEGRWGHADNHPQFECDDDLIFSTNKGLMRIVICTLIPLFHNVRMRWTAEAEDMREAMSEVAVLGKTRQGHWIQRSGGRETAMDWWASNGLMTNGRALNNYFSRKHKSEWVMFLNIFTSENNAACEMKRIH